MISDSNVNRLGAFALAFALASGSAAAQTSARTGSGAQGAGAQPPAGQPQPAAPVYTENVEVVATRLPEAPNQVPASIEVFSGSRLRALGATNLRDALSLATGVDVAPGGDAGPAGAVPEFWGLREFDAFLLVVDGIPWGGAFNPSLTSLSLRDVERVEVLRGSAPVTYGATSFVGVIHVVHKSGAAAGRNAAFRVGSYTSGGAATDFSLPDLGSWKSRVSVDADRQGFSDDRTSFRRAHAAYRMARGADSGRTWLMADLNWLGQDPASPRPREGSSLSPNVAVDANHNPAGAFVDETRLTAAFGTERSVGSGMQWNLTGSFSHAANQQFRGFLTDISDTPDNATGLRENIDQNDVYVDTHVTWPERSRVRLVAGADYLFGNGEGRGATFTYTVPLAPASAPVVPEPTVLDKDAEARRNFFGAYLLAEYRPVARLGLSGGFRLNVTRERHGEGETASYTRPGGSVGALFTVADRGTDYVRLFANYRNTFKPAAFDFSLAENEGVLKPETAQSYEGGIKVRTAAGRLDLETSVFRMDFENLVTSTVVDGLPALVNAGKTRFKGIEVGSELRLAKDVSVRASYSFHDGRFVDYVQEFDGVPQQLGGNRFEMSARHLVSTGVVVAPDRGVVGSLVVRYTGDRYLNKRNTALAAPFTTLDVGIGYRLTRWELRLDARNLTDRRDAVSESELGDAQYYLMTARRADVTIGVRY
jgi:iron complex outermembrane recepter protein